MFTPEFNSLVSQDGSKGLVLSKATLKLVRDALDDIGTQASGNVICDKHGGRNRYDDLISSAFDDEFVFRLEESSARSRYRMGQMEFCFQTRAEEHLPVALASMVSKYVREIMMMHFNQFWRAHLPNLKPTKGYPLDARRFWKATAQTAQRLQIERSQLWRQR
jgi:ribonuclease HII